MLGKPVISPLVDFTSNAVGFGAKAVNVVQVPALNTLGISMVLQKGDVFAFPVGLVHFQHNVGRGNAVAIAALSSQNPGVITIANAVFGSNAPIASDLLAKAFQIDKKKVEQIQSNYISSMEEAADGQFSQVYSLNESKEDNRDVSLAGVELLLPCEIFFEILNWLPVKILDILIRMAYLPGSQKKFHEARLGPKKKCPPQKDNASCDVSSGMFVTIRIVTYEGSLVFNVDGASLGNPGPSGVGGILRDKDGITLCMFSPSIGFGSADAAEVAAILQGCQLCSSDHCPTTCSVIIESDSKRAVSWVNGIGGVSNVKLLDSIMEIKEILARLGSKVVVRFVPRSGNVAADFLAKQGAASGLSQVAWAG
ncbi:hypothetical protein EZV62_027928 [Acer yangbiense]|uniref:RNase H type-1 domain-containing protein n=1 Tax=Acer yangbiense TaxID=1000413 RepID=A0A5C7GP27_9ROSI|nr:hypothetical protein EZV62_027928 [Acer yangbiense]